MLLRCTCTICPGFELLTAGESCFYLLRDGGTTCLFDCGSSLHVFRLVERLKALEPAVESIDYLLLTQPSFYRIGGLPYLRNIFPTMQILTSGPLKRVLTSTEAAKPIYENDCKSLEKNRQRNFEVLPFETYFELLEPHQTFPDSETIELSDEIRVYCFLTPGHTAESISYRIQPFDFVVTDQAVGYFRGSSMAAPGGSFSLEESLETIKALKDIKINGLCLPFAGTLTGSLIHRHLNAVVQNTCDLINECKKARQDQVPDENIFSALRDSFYTTESRDPFLNFALEETLRKVWEQVF